MGDSDERDRLHEMNITAGFATIAEREVQPGEKVHIIGNNGETDSTVTNLMENPRNPMMELQVATRHGASGCPIINDDLQLVGLLVGGGAFGNPQARDYALLWNHGIQEYIRKGVSIIANVGSYMACSTTGFQQEAEETENLAEKASDSQLTIYLMNGDIIKGGPKYNT